MSTKIYTAHVNDAAADPADALVLVREGFSVAAFLIGLPWLLYRRLWFAAACYIGLWVALGMWTMVLGMHPVTAMCIQLFLQLMLGFHARDLERLKLSRRGWRFAGIVVAENDLAAEQRYYAHAA